MNAVGKRLSVIIIVVLIPFDTVFSEDTGSSRFSPIPQEKGHAGLFVGVNEFSDSSLNKLSFAVNDAIAMAHLFVIELQIIQPDHAVLTVSGKPAGETAEQQLSTLQKAGVMVAPANKSSVLQQMARVSSFPQKPEDMIIVSISSHGFETNTGVYVVPQDGVVQFLTDTGVSIATLENWLADREKCNAGKRLLILDACRSNPFAGKGAEAGMSEAFQKALGQAVGQVVITACDRGQRSYEDDKAKLGGFTAGLVRALRGEAKAGADGLIRLSNVVDFVSGEVGKWAWSVVGQPQNPWFKGTEDARKIPLAIDPKAAADYKEVLRKRKDELEKRKDTLWQLNRDQTITDAQRAEGIRLLDSDDSLLGVADRDRRSVFVRVADRRIEVANPEELNRFLPPLTTPPTQGPVIREDRDKAPPSSRNAASIPDPGAKTNPVETKKRPAGELIGKPAPTFAPIRTFDGRSIGSEDFSKNKATVMNFVAGNCGFCKKQVPRVETIRADYEAKGVRFVNVIQKMGAKEFTPDEIKGIFSGVGSKLELAFDKDNQIGGRYKATGFPTMFVIDSKGNVATVIVGNAVDVESQLKIALDNLLGG